MLTSGATGPGGWKSRLYRSSGELGAGTLILLVAGVMARLSNVPMWRSEEVEIAGVVGAELDSREVWRVGGHSVGSCEVGDVIGDGEESTSEVSESISA